MKKIKILTSAILLGSLLSTSAVFAAETKHIPGHMAPGTVIKYNQDNKMEVVKQGKENRAFKADSSATPENLPSIKPGMTVVYDALGGAVVIVPEKELNKDNINVEMKEVTNSDLKADSKSSVSKGSQSGKISWFDIWAESDTASGQKASDGAAHKTLRLKSLVSVYDNETGNSTRVRILDRGPYVSGRILDMSEESFSQVDNTDKGVFSGSISW